MRFALLGTQEDTDYKRRGRSEKKDNPPLPFSSPTLSSFFTFVAGQPELDKNTRRNKAGSRRFSLFLFFSLDHLSSELLGAIYGPGNEIGRAK